ncbi:MAG: hypothetical protein ACFFAU_18125, partial [Candidatus Hodarchaeota archaeon]
RFFPFISNKSMKRILNVNANSSVLEALFSVLFHISFLEGGFPQNYFCLYYLKHFYLGFVSPLVTPFLFPQKSESTQIYNL